MACKHENADHLMPHDRIEVYEGDIMVLRGYAACEQLRCLDCGAWLSLGPSNDEPDEVRVEIRAAGLLACHAADDRICQCFEPRNQLPPDLETAARELELIARDIPYERIAEHKEDER